MLLMVQDILKFKSETMRNKTTQNRKVLFHSCTMSGLIDTDSEIIYCTRPMCISYTLKVPYHKQFQILFVPDSTEAALYWIFYFLFFLHYMGLLGSTDWKDTEKRTKKCLFPPDQVSLCNLSHMTASV